MVLQELLRQIDNVVEKRSFYLECPRCVSNLTTPFGTCYLRGLNALLDSLLLPFAHNRDGNKWYLSYMVKQRVLSGSMATQYLLTMCLFFTT